MLRWERSQYCERLWKKPCPCRTCLTPPAARVTTQLQGLWNEHSQFVEQETLCNCIITRNTLPSPPCLLDLFKIGPETEWHGVCTVATTFFYTEQCRTRAPVHLLFTLLSICNLLFNAWAQACRQSEASEALLVSFLPPRRNIRLTSETSTV